MRLRHQWRYAVLAAGVVATAGASWSCWGSDIFRWNNITFECASGTFEAQGPVIGSSPLGPGIPGGNNWSFGPVASFCTSSADVNHIARCWNQGAVKNPDASAPGCVYAVGIPPNSSCSLPLDAGGVEVIFSCEDMHTP